MKLSSFGRMALGLFLLLGTCALAGPPGSGYHLLKKIPLGAAPSGSEYFDYVVVDPDARRVYLTHGAEVKVINADSYEVLGTIGPLQKCHGVLVLKDLGKGFITDGDAEEVAVFDLASMKITGHIKTNEEDTDSIFYDPASKHIFTFNGHSKTASVIDAKSETLLKTIDLGAGPEAAVPDGKGHIYDNNEDLSVVMMIDTKTNEVKDKWPVAPEGQPVAMTMDRQHRRLFSAGRNPAYLDVMNADDGKVIQSYPITAGTDAAIFEPSTKLLFVSTREGYIHIFHQDTPDKYTEVDKVQTEYGAKTMGLDPKTHKLFLTTADFGQAPAPGKLPAPIKGTFRVLIYGK
jgi:DNA-binding beta-propeller fold protein YncE